MSDIDFVAESQSDDELLKLLGRKQTDASSDKAKTEDVFNRKNAASDTSSFDNAQGNGYDLTNPNLHYGTRFQGASDFTGIEDSSVLNTKYDSSALKEVESPSLQPRAPYETEQDVKTDPADGLSAPSRRSDSGLISADIQDAVRQTNVETTHGDSQVATKSDISNENFSDKEPESSNDVAPQGILNVPAGAASSPPSQPSEAQTHAPVISSNGGNDNAAVSVDENSLFVTKVTATDLDPGTSLIYTIVGGSDAALFAIDPATGDLVFKSAPDRENPGDVGGDNLYDVIVQVSDGVNIDQQHLAINVSNVNEGPSDATLTNNSINENSAAGTIIGTVAGVDPDAGASFTYQIVGGDSAKYQIDATTGAISLKAGVALDHEADALDSVTIRITDQGGLSTDKTFAINVSNVNEGPTATHDTAETAENSSLTLNVLANDSDPDGDALTITAASVTNGQGSVSIVDGQLVYDPGDSYNHLSDGFSTIKVRVSGDHLDGAPEMRIIVDGNIVETISVTANRAAGEWQEIVVTGNFGPDGPQQVQVAFTNDHYLAGVGDRNLIVDYIDVNGTVYQAESPDTSYLRHSDTIAGQETMAWAGALQFDTSNNAGPPPSSAEVEITYTISDGNGQQTTETAIVTVQGQNDAPTDATLTNNNILENSAAGTIVGTVAGVDPDAGASFTYAIIGGDSAKYQIDATTGAISLKAGVALDHEADALDSVTIRITDQGGLSTDKTFAINVSNVNEGPTGISIRADTLREDVTSGGTIGTVNTNAGRPFATLSATDPDSGETFTYSIVGGDSAKYEIVNGNQVQVKAGVSLNYESDNADSITVRVTDSAGNTIDQQFNFNITNYSGSHTGTSAADKIQGTSEEDTITGGGGNDYIDGGTGSDTVNYSGTHTNYSFALNSDGTIAVTDLRSGSPDGADTLVNVETLHFSDQNSGFIVGTTGNDTLNSTNGNDVLVGGDGNDTFNASYGLDVFDGGTGTDTISYAGMPYNMTIDLNAGLGYVTGYVAGADHIHNIENATGGSLNDILIGNSSANVLNGGDGNDTLKGDAGNDTLTGGAGDDVAVYSGASTNYSLTLNTDGTVTVVDLRSGSPDGTDTLSGIETLRFSDGDFTLQTGTTAAETMTGTSGNDITLGGDGNDQFSGTAGNDIINGGAAWWDTINYSSETSNLSIDLTTGTASGGTIGTDTIKNFEEVRSGSGSDTITGNATAATMIYAGAGNDTITTGTGDDYIEGQSGADAINGGAGNDWAIYASSSSGVTVNLATNINSGGDAQGDSLTNIENVAGSALNDTLTGNSSNNSLYGDAGDDTLNGGAGTDYIDGGTGTDTIVYSGNAIDYDFSVSGNYGVITDLRSGSPDGTDYVSNVENLQFGDRVYVGVAGTNSNDTMTGTTGNDGLFGLDGNDTLIGGSGGNDLLNGGAGNDTIRVEGGADTLIGGTGTDILDLWTTGDVTVNLAAGTVSGSGTDGTRISGFETVWGGDGNDTISGTTANESLYGGIGNDTIDGGGGNDYLNGEAGTDTVSFATASSGVTVSLATTSVQYISADPTNPAQTTTNTVYSTQNTGIGTMTIVNFENVTGSGYNDTLTGDSSSNTMSGGAGSDTIYAGSGNDTIIGGAGNDTLYGQGGADIFTYYTGDGNDTVYGGASSSGVSWTDTMDLHSGASTLGTYGVDWTVTLTTGSISSVDNTNHALSLSNDAAGSIHLQDGSTLNFSELERITWS